MKATYSDEEIDELLSSAGEDWVFEINIDERAFDFWFKNKYGMPVPMLDMKYARYVVKTLAFGNTTDDYWVVDEKNPFFSASLDEFLSMDEKGSLPVEATPEQFRRRKLRNMIISITTSLGVLLYLLIMLEYLV